LLQNFTVKLVDEAKRDLQGIEDYIYSNSPQNARTVREELEAAIDSLVNFPYRFKICETNSNPDKVVHSMPVPPFIV